MKLEITTKFAIGQLVYFIENSVSYEEISCTHCGGKYREIVNNIEYTCPYCVGGREKRRIDRYEVRSGVITNIRVALYGVDKTIDAVTGIDIDTKIKYSVTRNNTEHIFADDGNSYGKFEGELYESIQDAEAAVVRKKTIKTIKEG